jgi:hypothetical protein
MNDDENAGPYDGFEEFEDEAPSKDVLLALGIG